jgi:hypothetical protein
MSQYATTPDDSVRRPIVDTRARKGNNRGINTADRIALGAMLAVAILILVMVALTCKSATQPMPAAASVAMSSYVGLPVSVSDRRMPNTSRKDH